MWVYISQNSVGWLDSKEQRCGAHEWLDVSPGKLARDSFKFVEDASLAAGPSQEWTHRHSTSVIRSARML
jgi:uncharacterized protein YfaT (DUF1175 family)